MCFFFFSSRRRHTRFKCDWSSDVCSSDLSLALSANQKLIKKNVTGIGFALSASDLIEVLHRFYPNVAVASQAKDQTTIQPMARENTPSDETSVGSSSGVPEGVGTVTITSEPDSAEIFVDDKFLGNAPAILTLPAGSHAILLKFPGHTDWRRTLEVLKSSKTTLKATLEPAS